MSIPAAEVDFDHEVHFFALSEDVWKQGEEVTTREPEGGRWMGRVEFAAGKDAVVLVTHIDDRLAPVKVKIGDRILYRG